MDHDENREADVQIREIAGTGARRRRWWKCCGSCRMCRGI